MIHNKSKRTRWAWAVTTSVKRRTSTKNMQPKDVFSSMFEHLFLFTQIKEAICEMTTIKHALLTTAPKAARFSSLRGRTINIITTFLPCWLEKLYCYHISNNYPFRCVFGLFLLNFSSFKTRLLGRGFHALIKNVSFYSPTNVGSHNPPSSRAQHSRRHLFPSPINMGPPNPPPIQSPTSLLVHRLRDCENPHLFERGTKHFL